MYNLLKVDCPIKNAILLYCIMIVALLVTKPKFIHRCDDNSECKYTFIFPLCIVILAVSAYYTSRIVTKIIT
jgi:hypothetical protein